MAKYKKKETIELDIGGSDTENKPITFNLKQLDPNSMAELTRSRDGSTTSEI